MGRSVLMKVRTIGRRPSALAMALTVGLLGVASIVRDATADVRWASACPLIGTGGLVGEVQGSGLNQPYGIAVSPLDGTVYVSERNWNVDPHSQNGRARVVSISPGGVVAELALGPADSRLGKLAIDATGTTLYVAAVDGTGSETRHRIYSLDLTVQSPVFVLVGGAGSTGSALDGVPATTAFLGEVADVEVSPSNGLLYAAVGTAGATPPSIREIDEFGTIRTVVGGAAGVSSANPLTPASTASLASAVALAFAPDGTMNIGVNGSNRIVRRIPPVGGGNPYGDGTITTFTGGGGDAVSGDGGSAAAARIGDVRALATDPAGNLFVSGFFTHNIRRTDAAGTTITTIAGETGAPGTDTGVGAFADGTGDVARFAYPGEMAFGNGALFVADSRNNRVRRIEPGATAATTTVATFAGNGPNLVDTSGPAITRQIGLPDGITHGPDGRLYLVDVATGRVWRRELSGAIDVVAGTGAYRGLTTAPIPGPATGVPLETIRDVQVSADNSTLYILERTRVFAVDLGTGILTVLAGSGSLTESSGFGTAAGLDTGARGSMALSGGALYVSGSNRNVRRIDLGTAEVTTPITDLTPTGNAVVLSLESDGAGGLFIGTTDNRLHYWDGSLTTIAGTGALGEVDGSPASTRPVSQPRGLAFRDGPGDDDVLYFLNGSSPIRSLTPADGVGAARWANGTLARVAGGGAQSPFPSGGWGDGADFSQDGALVRFWSLSDMDVDPDGRIVVTDYDSAALPASRSATNTGPHTVRVLTDAGCSEASLGGPPIVGTASSSGVPLASLPLAQLEFDVAAIAATPMRAVPMRAVELETTPMRATPMRAVPMRAVPMRAVGLDGTPLAVASVSAFPLDPLEYPGGWPQRFEGTPLEGRTPQQVRLSDLYLDANAAALDKEPPITIADIALADSPMRAVSLASIALGATPMRAVPLREDLVGEGRDDERFDAWCDLLTDGSIPEISRLGYSCASLGLTSESPLLALDIASVPMRAVPMRAVPMRAVDISASPMRAVRLRESGIARPGDDVRDLRASPMRAVPMRAVLVGALPMRAVPLNAIPMRAVDVNASPMRAVLLSSLGNPGAVTDCGPPTCFTLGDAADRDAIKPGATLWDLIDALDEAVPGLGRVPQLGDLRFGNRPLAGIDRDDDGDIDLDDEVNLGEIIPYLPDEPFISLADVLSGFIGSQDIPWEDVDLDSMGIGNPAGGTTYEFSFDFRVYPNQADDVPVSITLPAGWRYDSTSNATITPDGAASTPLALPPRTPAIDPATSAQTLTYSIPATPGSAATIALDLVAFPGNRLGGPVTATATIGPVIRGGASRTVQSSPVTVVDTTEAGNNSYDTAAGIEPDQLYLGHLNAPGDVDYFRLVPPNASGTIERIHLSHLPVDADLVVYKESLTQFNFRDSVAKLRQQADPIPMAEPSGGSLGGVLEPQRLQDIPTEPGKVVASISANRGTATESIEIITDDPNAYYVIAVRGYNGAASDEPYALRVQQITPPGSPTCPGGPAGPFALPELTVGETAEIGSVPASTETLILANRERLIRQFGDAAQPLLVALDQFADRPGVNGQVVLVDGSQAVRDAYRDWENQPCGLGLPNFVVRAINDYVDEIRARSPGATSIENMVLVGSDEQIPMARLIDNTNLANEIEYGAELVRSADSAADPPISTPQTVALASKSLLSDDPYASFAPKLFGPDVTYPPDLAIGRLVENPTEIMGMLAQFDESAGSLEPENALITGYDFLSDGAREVRDGLAGAVPDDADRDGELIAPEDDPDGWTAGQLATKLSGTSDGPDIASVNAHFDHHRLLPARGDTDPDAELFTTADLDAQPDRLRGSVLFSMGCHSGVGWPDWYAGGAGGDALDWPQAFAQQRSIWVANSGYGYGDTAQVMYSERLMSFFAAKLGDGQRVGEALRLAKQEYLSKGIANSYDAKVMSQIIFYGLPMFRVGGNEFVPPPPKFVPTTPDPSAGGLPSYTVTAVPALRISDPSDAPEPDQSRYFYTTDASEPVGTSLRRTHIVDGRPIQPRLDVDVTASGLEARGAVVTALEMTSQSLDVTVARPVVDAGGNEPPIFSPDMVFPSAFQNVTTFVDESGPKNNLVLVPGQWIADADPATPPNRGTQRLFTSMTSTVYYAPRTSDDDLTRDLEPPTISRTSASTSGPGVTFRATVSDRTLTGSGPVVRVSVLYLDGSIWRSAELSPSGPGEFRGAGPATEDQVDYFVQAVDGSGNVAVSSNKAQLFRTTATPAPEPGKNAAPIIAAPTPVNATAQQPVTFSGTFNDPDGSTSWSGTVNSGNGRVGSVAITGTAYTATLPAYSAPGSYVATLSICDDAGACDVAVVPITVTPAVTGDTFSLSLRTPGRQLSATLPRSAIVTQNVLPGIRIVSGRGALSGGGTFDTWFLILGDSAIGVVRTTGSVQFFGGVFGPVRTAAPPGGGTRFTVSTGGIGFAGSLFGSDGTVEIVDR